MACEVLCFGPFSQEGQRDVDFVLTTREFGKMLRHAKIPLASLPEEKFDDPLGQASGAAALFGATGGVMEAALRTAYAVVTGKPLTDLKIEPVRGLQVSCTLTLS